MVNMLAQDRHAAQTPSDLQVVTWRGDDIARNMARWKAFIQQHDALSLNCQPEWLTVLASGLQHEPYCVEATVQDRIVGLLPLAYVNSFLFGKFLVSLPYINTAGVVADNEETAVALIDQAVALADRLRVKHLELRHEAEITHPALTQSLTSKVHMRLSLPPTVSELWDQFNCKARNQVRKGEKQGFTVHWGGAERLPEFYEVFSHNMRDLGTPVFSRKLFSSILECFPQQSEICVVRAGQQPIAVALLTHGNGSTEVPSASSLRAFGSRNANDCMYWQLLQRAVERGQRKFDFGRSTVDSNTYVFKKKWGAIPEPAVWQYYIRSGSPDDMRRENTKYDRFISVWQKLPLPLTRWIGPAIVRGIP